MHQIQLAMSPYTVSKHPVISPAQRYQVVVDLSKAGSDYRDKLYRQGLSANTRQHTLTELNQFFDQCMKLLDATIENNRRADGLFHSYNLMSRAVPGEIHIERLYEMLEGQVAVLSSGILSIEEVNTLLDALRNSQLYRDDQGSFIFPETDDRTGRRVNRSPGCCG